LEYPKHPLVGAAAVVRKIDEILLVKRARPPKAGYYSIPGGLVKLGERIGETAKREVLEETGLMVELEKLVDVVDNIVLDEKGKIRFHYVIVNFLARPVGGELKASSDILDVKWVRFDDLQNYQLTNTAKYLLKKLGFL